jgi:TPP-dependent indolepyruvate ferredoxin oxidoreductase alpha subunit
MLAQARKTRRALLAAKRLCEKRLPQLREASTSLANAAAAVTSSGSEAAGPASTPAGAVTDVVAQARRLDELCDSLARASGQESRRRSTLTGAAASGASGLATFGDVRAAFDADSAAGAAADTEAAKAAANALA